MSPVARRVPFPWITVPAAMALTVAVISAACGKEVGDAQLLFPTRYPLQAERPDRLNIEVPLADGTTLRGWHLYGEHRDRTVIYWYGNGETVLGSMYRLEWMARELNVNVVAVDYRGYGFSGGTATVHAVLQDAAAVYDYARDELGVDRPILFGRSLGTAPAIRVAGERPVRGLILEAPFPSLAAVLKAWQHAMPIPFRWFVRLRPAHDLTRFEHQPIDVIRRYGGPLLVLHGEEDQTIPPELGRQVFEAAATTNKTWLSVPETDHNNLTVNQPDVSQALRAFVGVLPPQPPVR